METVHVFRVIIKLLFPLEIAETKPWEDLAHIKKYDLRDKKDCEARKIKS